MQVENQIDVSGEANVAMGHYRESACHEVPHTSRIQRVNNDFNAALRHIDGKYDVRC